MTKVTAFGSAIKRRLLFGNSTDYWEKRYRKGGDSCAGSYNRLAAFKAHTLNGFVAAHDVESVIEFGSGDGAQLELAKYPRYTGVDVSTTVLDATRRKFAGDPSMRFLHTSDVTDGDEAELALSLDVIYHLVEDEVFDGYMHQLFAAATRYVIIYASNDDRPWPDPHVRHRTFTRWVDHHHTGFAFTELIPNAYPYSKDDPDNTSFADFYVFERA